MRIFLNLLRSFFLLGSFLRERSTEGNGVLGRLLNFRSRGGRRSRGLFHFVSVSKNSLNDFFDRETFKDFTEFDVVRGSTTNNGSN